MFGGLLRLEADMPGFLGELIEQFGGGCGRRLGLMRQALATGNVAILAAAAHGMRGSCGTIGALGMARLAERIEEATGKTERRLLVRRLEAEYARVTRALDTVLEERLSASAR